VIKSAAQILAEIGHGTEEDDLEHERKEQARRAEALARPLKRPGYKGYTVRQNAYPENRKLREPKPKRLCELVPGCTNPHVGLGACWKHYYRLRTYGDPLGGPKPRTKLGKIEGLGEG
jgi:hypothetical protein